jgi:hypothetical protein
MFQPEAELLIVVKRGPNTQEMADSSPRASFENPYFRVADQPPKRRTEAPLARTDLLDDLEVLR